MCCAGALFRATSVREELLGGGAGATPPLHPLLQQHSLPVLTGAPLPMSPPPPVRGGARNGVFGRNPCNPELPRLLQQHSLPAPMGGLLPMSPPPAARGSGLSRTVSNPNPDPQRLLHQHTLPAGQPLPMSPPPAVRAGVKPELLDPSPSNPDHIGMDSHPDLGSLAELEAFWAAAQGGSIGSGRVGFRKGSDPVSANTGPGAGAAGAGGELEESPQVDTPEGAYSLFPEGLQVRVSLFWLVYACLILGFPSFCHLRINQGIRMSWALVLGILPCFTSASSHSLLICCA